MINIYNGLFQTLLQSGWNGSSYTKGFKIVVFFLAANNKGMKTMT